MFSLQNFIARDSRIFSLLEESAVQGQASIQNVIRLLNHQEQSLEPFAEARRKEKRAVNEIREHLVRTFVTPLDREDIDALSTALYKIPKTAERFSERYLMAGAHTQGADFSRQVEMLERAGSLVVSLVTRLRHELDVKHTQDEHRELQRIEGEADKLMLTSLRDLYDKPDAGLRALVMKDLHELLEKIFDRCRDVGNVIFIVALKHS
jgi:uncharacterized protein